MPQFLELYKSLYKESFNKYVRNGKKGILTFFKFGCNPTIVLLTRNKRNERRACLASL